jgi:AraC family transcriptional activator of pobA
MTQDTPDYFFASLQSGLQSRALVSPLPASLRPWQCVFLQSGSLQILDTGQDTGAQAQVLEAPALVYWPVEAGLELNLRAGSTGVHLALGELFLVSVLGKRPEASELRDAILNFATLHLKDKPQTQERILAILSEIALEREALRPGQLLFIEAQLRCLVVHLWRNAQNVGATSLSIGHQMMILRKFRQLVEAQFHERWRVNDYASALSITPDRLHNIVTRALDRTPLQLIHERSHREARNLLTRTNMTLDQIADHLGYPSTPQFSAFFRNLEGKPPGRYRADILAYPEQVSKVESVDLSDWP